MAGNSRKTNTATAAATPQNQPLEVLALLLTAALIGAVAASQGGEKTKEDTDDA